MVGAGVSGLRVALNALDRGQKVTLVEGRSEVGGLTSTQTLESPEGPVEVDRFYHVIMESDATVRALLDDLGLGGRVIFTSAPAELVSDGQQYPASSIVQMAMLPALKLADRLRIGFSGAASLALPLRLADTMTSASLLRRLAGKSAYKNFWGPILRAKLGTQADQVSATLIVSTFRRLIQARLKGAGDRFGVLPRGYAPIVSAMRARVEARGGEFRTGTAVTNVRSEGTGEATTVTVTLEDGSELTADQVVLTTPGPVTTKLVPQLTPRERAQLTSSPYLGVVCGVYLLDTPPNDSYITYLTDDVGLTGVIGMHALLGPRYTGGGYLVYLPHYCASDDPWFDEDDDVLADRLFAAMQECFPHYTGRVLARAVNKARYVVPLPLPKADPPLPFVTSVPGVVVVSTAQNRTGTLNVEGSLSMADEASAAMAGAHDPSNTNK
ncbi:FAD-dependent oxidoreductase [Nigerium massiliense]|uniref:FAD-dependent oxidoreductase n=1 Tax=Nigerium massiliense TaxID=1522317 RepID=UPI0009077494|nr:FAD-dependent oxidoreductase [Nigerium massiliense]